MTFQYQQPLIDYIKKHGKRTIVVEMVEINNSDFEVTELHVHFTDGRMREHFLTKKRYRSVETAHGEVLLPPFPLEMEDTVVLGLRRFMLIPQVTCSGIKV